MRIGLLGKSCDATGADASSRHARNRRSAMSAGTLWLVASMLVAVGFIGVLFLYGWRHRKDRMPDVPPLPPEEDDWRK
jgi:hypothetical protein